MSVTAAERTYDVVSPIEGVGVVGKVKQFSKDEVEAALKRASAAWRPWNARTLSERAAILVRASGLIRDAAPELMRLLTLEIGKNRHEAEAEVLRTADLVHYFAEEGRRYYGELIWGDSFPGYGKEKLCMVYREPHGVVVAIGPFNYPLNLLASKIAPALITGNAVVAKPPQQGSLACMGMLDCFARAGVPAGVLECVTGEPGEFGDFLCTHPLTGMVSFTGSTRVGKHLATIIGLCPIQMELGGKDAALVLSDADLDLAAKEIVKGGFSYSGQRCTGVKRVLVVPEVADALVERVRAGVEKLGVGDPREPGVVVGPVISDKSSDYVWSLIEDALGKGAVALTGNRRAGRLIQPTLLDRVTEDMRVAWEEPFGPVVPILRVRDMDDAVRVANASQFGLQSCVFTRDLDRAFHIGRVLEVGTVNVNGADSRGPDHFPFMGCKSSGMLTQGIHYSISAMVRDRAITLNLRPPKG